MSCTLSHECRVMLAELLAAEKDDTRVWVRAEMDRLVDPLVDSVFARLTNKLTNGLGRTQTAGAGECAQVGNSNPCFLNQATNLFPQPSTSSPFNTQFVNMNYSHQQKCYCEECVDVKIEVKKEEDDDDEEEELSCAVKRPNEVVNELLDVESRMGNEKTIDTRATIGEYSGDGSNDSMVIQQSVGEVSNCLPQNELTQGPNVQQMHFEDDLEIPQEILDEVKREIEEEEEMKRRQNEHEGGDERHDEGDRVESELSEATNTQTDFGEHFQLNDDETEIDDEEYEMEVDGEESSDGDDETEVVEQLDKVPDDRIELHRNVPKAIDIQSTFGEHNSDESMAIQEEERDANNAIGGEFVNECTTNPTQPNLAQPNHHLQCSHCHKLFVSKSKLQRHLRGHTGERPFQCDQCDKRFSQPDNLKAHQNQAHKNIKRFRCDHCKKRFNRRYVRDSHLLTHSGEQPFQCRHCDKKFNTLGNRNRHEQGIHLHIKPQRARNIIDERDPRELVEKV